MTPPIEQFVTLWVVIDPIGTVPVFIAVTAAMSVVERKRTALMATLVGIGVLLFFLIFGQLLIDALDIGLNSFQVAGGIVLFLFALTMIFGEPKCEADQKVGEDDIQSAPDKSPSVFPLAVPSLASPGAMLAIVLLTDNRSYSIPEQAVTGVVMVAVMAAGYLMMRLADPIIRAIGMAGAAIISRVMGMILASVAANSVLSAILAILETGTL
ncbi:MAG: MarC family protein [Rhodobacteraceae bacterium]|nr:MarC family protein [Paracoccaceae bacterium]